MQATFSARRVNRTRAIELGRGRHVSNSRGVTRGPPRLERELIAHRTWPSSPATLGGGGAAEQTRSRESQGWEQPAQNDHQDVH
jgi:hypothetical protein